MAKWSNYPAINPDAAAASARGDTVQLLDSLPGMPPMATVVANTEPASIPFYQDLIRWAEAEIRKIEAATDSQSSPE